MKPNMKFKNKSWEVDIYGYAEITNSVRHPFFILFTSLTDSFQVLPDFPCHCWDSFEI